MEEVSMTPFKTDVNALRPAGQTTQPHLRASATNNKVTQALTLIHDRAATRISPAGAGTFKPLTAEQAAGNILGFIERQIQDRKSTRLNSSHVATSYAVFC